MLYVEYVKNCFKTFFLNNESVDYINEKIDWKMAFGVVWGLYSFILFIGELFIEGISGYSIMVTFGKILFLIPLGLFFVFGLVYLFLRLFGGESDFFETFKFGISVILFPVIIIYFFEVIRMVFNLNVFFNILFYIFEGGLFVWSLRILVNIYSVIHSISKLRVFLAVFLCPFLVVLVLGIISVVVANFLFVSPQIASQVNIDPYSGGGEILLDSLKLDGNDSILMIKNGLGQKKLIDNITISLLDEKLCFKNNVEIFGEVSSIKFENCNLSSKVIYNVMTISKTGIVEANLVVR